MIMKVFTVRDGAVNAYNTPFYARTSGEAIRSFRDLVRDNNTNVSRYPTDFTLWLLGEYDDSSGLFTCGEPIRVIGATEVLALE